VFGELAKELNNLRKGTDFKSISAEDLKERYYEVTTESLRAFGVILAPGVGISGAIEAVATKAKTAPEVAPEIPEAKVAKVEQLITEENLSVLAQKRLNELETISKGIPANKEIGFPGQPARLFTPEEKAEYDFLKENIDDASALAKGYGYQLATEEVVAEAQTVGQVNALRRQEALTEQMTDKELAETVLTAEPISPEWVAAFKEMKKRKIEAEETREVAPEEAAPPTEEPMRQIKKGKRNALIRKTVADIEAHEVYQLEVEGVEARTQQIGPGFYYVEPALRREVLDIIGDDKRLRAMFTFDPTKGALDWTKAVQEALGRGKEGIAEAAGEMDITEFVEAVKFAVETGKKTVVNEYALERAVDSGEPMIDLLQMKYDMLKKGFTPDEINDTIEQWLKDHPDISREAIEDQFITVKEKDYVKEKPRILREEERKARKAKARLTPEQAAIKRAKDRATTKKEVVFVYKTDGKFTVSKKPPKNIPYTKISPPKGKKLTTTVERIGPIPEEAATQKQKARAHIIAKQKKLLSEKGKPTPGYRRLAKGMTGQTSMAMMTQEQADTFIDALESLVERGRGLPPKIPTTTDMITGELAEKIGKFKDIGFLERFRPAWRVFERIGLMEEVFRPTFTAEVKSMEELFSFRDKVKEMRDSVGATDAVAAKLFREVENPGTQELKEAEKSVVKWAKRFFDDWANRLHIPAEKRIKNYVTHIFEAAITRDLKAKYPLDPDLVKALEFVTPKTIFNPFLQERLNRKIGLRENLWAALEAYENKALKKFYYEPLIQRLRVYRKFLPPNASRYLRDYIARITDRPLVIDREINQTLKEVAADIEAMPGGKQLAEYLTRGNAAGMLAYNMTGIYYECWLGLRPASAIKNLSQHGLILCEAGPTAFGKALATTGQQRADLLAKSEVLKGRKSGFLPGVDQTYIEQLESKRREVTMFMFKLADRKNVADAFLAGYFEAQEKGLSAEWCVKRGDEVARKTQYLYTKFAGSQFNQTAPGRVLGVLTTWPINWAELMNEWARGKPSGVYSAYEKKTGETISPTNFVARRKALWTYLAMVSLAMLIHKKTPFKAIYYTGWAALAAIADMVRGKLPGLNVPAIVADLVVGVATLDERRLKRAWNEAKNFVVIVRELKDILSGEKDWMNLFFYMEKEKKQKPKKIVR